MVDFIEEYLRVTARAESPTRYLWWGAISCISAVLRDNVWFDFPDRVEKLYPNMYILLEGESSIVRKSTPFNVNKKLLSAVDNTKILAGGGSIPGILKILANTETKGPKGGSAVIIAQELGAWFVDDPQTIQHLTNMYEFHTKFDKYLASYDVPVVNNLCLSMFLGSNEKMMERIITDQAKFGGLLARTIYIKEKKRRHKDSGFEKDSVKPDSDIWNPAILFLKKLSTISGPAKFNEKARERYAEWYRGYELEEYHTGTGFEGRLHSHILKMCIVLSAARSDFDQTIKNGITLEILDKSIEICSDLLPEYKKITYGSGSNVNANAIKAVTGLLFEQEATNFMMSRQKILFQLHGEVSGITLDEIMKDMEHAGLIEVKSLGGIPAYQLTISFVEALSMRADEVKKKQKSNPAT